QIRQKAIEEKYSKEAEAQDQIAQLRALGRNQEADAIAASLAEEEKLDSDKLARDLQRLKDSDAQKKAQADKAEADRLASYQQQLSDQQKAYDDQKSQTDKNYADQLKGFSDQRTDIEKKLAQSEQKILQSEQDNAAKIAAAAGIQGAAYDDLVKK